MTSRRLPAEWEEQDGVMIPWPHDRSDWAPLLDDVEPVFAQIVAAISRFERVLLLVPESWHSQSRLTSSGAVQDRILYCTVPTNDTWARDFGPLTVFESGKPLLLDFDFNGWGMKFPADLDNLITRRLHDSGVFQCPLNSVDLVLEGGSIESDGNGTLLTTSKCLLNSNRNPHLSRSQLEKTLSRELGASHVLWLENGWLAGDDTDSHIDTLARLCPDDTILYVACDDPADEHWEALSAMKRELEAFRTPAGKPYRLLPLPWPGACFDQEGNRIPATYANFLVLNSAVLVPIYCDQHDEEALETIRKAYPSRQAIGIDCRQILLQHGSLHCLTMQLPKGTLA